MVADVSGEAVHLRLVILHRLSCHCAFSANVKAGSSEKAPMDGCNEGCLKCASPSSACALRLFLRRKFVDDPIKSTFLVVSKSEFDRFLDLDLPVSYHLDNWERAGFSFAD
jgi:hypothetical protein